VIAGPFDYIFKVVSFEESAEVEVEIVGEFLSS
jgi:hypothetical protein